MNRSDGKQGEYFWIEWSDLSLSNIIELCPEIVLGHHVAITAFDSGPLALSSDERLAGWEMIGDVACSPRISAANQLPLGEYDEWYVFAERQPLGEHEVFVNYCGFSLTDTELMVQKLDPTWCKESAVELAGVCRAQQERFWNQLGLIRPESYLAEGDFAICVTRNEAIRDALLGR